MLPPAPVLLRFCGRALPQRVTQLPHRWSGARRRPPWAAAARRGSDRSFGVAPWALAAGAASAVAVAQAAGVACDCTGPEPQGPPLEGRGDAFGGLILDPGRLPCDAAVFERRLDHSISAWRGSGVRGVWMQVPTEKAHLIAIAVSRGFRFHHAEKHYCMLTRWLPTDEPSPLPPNASTQIGVGALVVNEEGKVLLVQEAVGPSRGKNIWKIPTGLLNPREDIKDGVVRECFEETGIVAEFEKVIAFRHSHSGLFGKSDIFFVCLLRSKSMGVPFQLQAAEIARAKWDDFHDFLQQAPYPRDTPVWAEFYQKCIGKDGVVGNVDGIRAEQLPVRKQEGADLNYIFY
mmetsp:Transcript_57712/g.185470  ORF Transcript_57712/g.185470 Transcript_57712/m.185470 type:complete len:346 (+) Transcript_57712:68-1105(+)